MLSRIDFLKIALEFTKTHGKIPCDDHNFPLLREGCDTDLMGLFIPASSYYATQGIERMTIYGMRDAGILNQDEMDLLGEIDEVAMLMEEEWKDELKLRLKQEKKNGQRKAQDR